MNRWIDITDDVSKKYYNAFIKQVGMPEYVKSAHVPTKDSLDNVSSEAFADNINRKFAVDSKANCWCSALYFYGNQCNTLGSSKQAEARLVKAARVWGISDEVERIKKAFEEVSIPATYAISFKFKGAQIDRCPDHTKEAATASSEWLYANRFKFPVEIQKQAAVRLQSKADPFKISTKAAAYLDKLANSSSYSNLNCKIACAITDRLNAIPSFKWGALEDEMLKVAQTLSSAPFDVCSSADLLVNALEALDTKSGMNSKWGSAIQHPVDVCYRANLTKAAAAMDSVVHLVTGTPVDLTKISDFQLEKGLKVAGDDFLSYCQSDGLNVDRSKAAEILPTLPKPEAQKFEQAIKTSGYIPETTYGLADRLFKESNYGMMPMGQAPMEQMPADDTNPMPGEDDMSFEARMNEKKEQAKLDALDAQAGLAAVKARQARQQHEQNMMGQAQGMQ
jgi:hypothetical protein